MIGFVITTFMRCDARIPGKLRASFPPERYAPFLRIQVHRDPEL
jgi:hypothetical protein